MNGSCRLERDVMRAAVDDRWTDALRRHVETCEECAAAAAVAPWMHGLARVDERVHVLPDPAVVWLKAQLLRGTAVAERATRPLAISQMMAYFAVAAGWAALLTWKWSALHEWLISVTPSALVANASGTQSASLSLSLLAIVLVLSSVTVALAMHTILAEE